MNMTQLIAKQFMEEKTNHNNVSTLKVGDTVMALASNGAFAGCFAPIEYTVAKINKKTFKAICGKVIPLINIR